MATDDIIIVPLTVTCIGEVMATGIISTEDMLAVITIVTINIMSGEDTTAEGGKNI
jgi:hypothetical protein